MKQKRMTKSQLLKAVDDAKTITDLFELVKTQDINMRMHTLPGASNIPAKRLEIRSFPPNTSYLDKLKAAVKLTIKYTK
ncbi:MAG: hypothetical protein ACI4RM_04340 [Ruminococcus sp.]